MKKAYKIILLASLFLSNFSTFAQPSSDDDTGNGNLDGNDVPVNGKLVYLIIAALVFAFFTIKNFKKKIA